MNFVEKLLYSQVMRKTDEVRKVNGSTRPSTNLVD